MKSNIFLNKNWPILKYLIYIRTSKSIKSKFHTEIVGWPRRPEQALVRAQEELLLTRDVRFSVENELEALETKNKTFKL